MNDPGAAGAAATVDQPRINVARIAEGHDPAAAALISRNRTITYGELVDQADRLRGGLAGLGLSDGDRVALMCGNGHPFVIAYLACTGLGAAVVPLNPMSPPAELERELAAVSVRAVIVDRSAEGWRDVDRSRLDSIQHMVAV